MHPKQVKQGISIEVWWLRHQLPLQGSNPSGELRTFMPGVAKKIGKKKKKVNTAKEDDIEDNCSNGERLRLSLSSAETKGRRVSQCCGGVDLWGVSSPLSYS